MQGSQGQSVRLRAVEIVAARTAQGSHVGAGQSGAVGAVQGSWDGDSQDGAGQSRQCRAVRSVAARTERGSQLERLARGSWVGWLVLKKYGCKAPYTIHLIQYA